MNAALSALLMVAHESAATHVLKGARLLSTMVALEDDPGAWQRRVEDMAYTTALLVHRAASSASLRVYVIAAARVLRDSPSHDAVVYLADSAEATIRKARVAARRL
jgi:hypothetical protein